ncbi:FIG00554048: hypothetical protein [Cronobacter muytjensii 530]
MFLIKRISHFCLLFRPADKRWTKKSPSLRGFYQQFWNGKSNGLAVSFLTTR